MARPPIEATRVANRLAARIGAGEYRAGDWLPPATQLTGIYGVNRRTVRAALADLERRGLVELVRNKGAMVLAQEGAKR